MSIASARGYDPMVILEQAFVPGFDNDIPMPSNRVLAAKTTDDEVYIRDQDNSKYHFDACVSTESEGAIFFSVDTVDRQGENQIHPDLYAAKLLGRAVRFFDAGPYGPLDRVEGTWLTDADSDNFAMYAASLAKFGPGPYTQEQMRIAAKETWTGGVLDKLGFKVVSSVHSKSGSHVQVYFDRPKLAVPAKSLRIAA